MGRGLIGAWACGVAVAVTLSGASCKSNNINATTNNSTEIGPSGGTIDGPDGIVVNVPAGAVASTTTFTIDALPSSAEPAPPPGTAYTGSVYSFEPHGYVFAAPVTIEIPNATSNNLFHANCPVGTPHDTSTGCTWDTATVSNVASGAFTASGFSLYALVSGAVATEGGTEGGPSWSASVTGSNSGASLPTVGGAVAASGTVTIGSGPGAGLAIDLYDVANTCSDLMKETRGSEEQQGTTTLGMLLVNLGDTTAIGATSDVPVIDPSSASQTSGIVAIVSFIKTDSACNFTPSSSQGGIATGGSVTISQVTSSAVSGSFTGVTFAGGAGTVSGSFTNLPLCTQFDLGNIDNQCSQTNVDTGFCCGKFSPGNDGGHATDAAMAGD